MRVLWFTNSSCNYMSGGGYNGGGWMTALQDAINSPSISSYIGGQKIELGICFCMNGQPEKVEQDDVVYYPVSTAVKSVNDKILDALYPCDVHRDEVLWGHYISSFKRVIEDFQPDVIEIFGSELYMGLAAMTTDRPCVLHIQGLLSLYIYIYLPTGVSQWSYIMKDGLRGAFGNWQYLNYWRRSAYREKLIFKHLKHVIGRTHWDKNATLILNPDAQYHYGGEMLRACFYEPSTRSVSDKLTITTTSSGATYKGFDLVLKIANILKDECHIDFEWNVYGNVDSKFFEKLTGIKHNNVNVNLCGVASAEELRESMLKSTLYVQPSYTENSPNSVCEAQMLGVPVVATNVGGTSSLVEHDKTGLLFPATDPYMGAYCIKRLYEDRNLNIKMGEEGKSIAFARHDKKKIVEGLVNTYKEIIADAK